MTRESRTESPALKHAPQPRRARKSRKREAERRDPTGNRAAANVDRKADKNESAWKPWQDNLFRMARRAAADESFYERSGSTVQRLADELREGAA